LGIWEFASTTSRSILTIVPSLRDLVAFANYYILSPETHPGNPSEGHRQNPRSGWKFSSQVRKRLENPGDDFSSPRERAKEKGTTVGNSHTCLRFHIIFGTKTHYPFLTGELNDRMHQYIMGIVKTDGSVPITVFDERYVKG
jgi:hypothetical protein